MTHDASVAVVFPGQGCQRPGMGRDFFDESREARQVFEEASDALALDVRKLCFDDDPRLECTEFAQPALLTVEIAMFRALRERFSFSPAWFAGHSLGEYTALCAAGVISLAECARLTRTRGRLMQTAMGVSRGAMLAVLAPRILEHVSFAVVESWGVDLANLNAPDQIVLSGREDAMQRIPSRIRELLGDSPHQLVELSLNTAFHSRFMRPVELALRESLENVRTSLRTELAPRVTSNFSGGFHSADAARLVDALARQASHPVNWVLNMRALSVRCARVVELGPGRPLARLFRSVGLDVVSVTSLKAADSALSVRSAAVRQEVRS